MGDPPFTQEAHDAAGGKVVVHRPCGVLNGHADCYEWLESVRRGIQGGRVRLVIDLAGVTRIDSTGLGILAAIHVSATNGGGLVSLAGLSDRNRRLLKATFLLRVLHEFDSEADAVRASMGDSPP